MSTDAHPAMPERLASLKREIVAATDEQKLLASWKGLLAELKSATDEIKASGTDLIPQVDFSDIQNLKPEDVQKLKHRGCILVKNVVEDSVARGWKDELVQYVKTNPVEGIPEDDKQFFMLYWTRPQVKARAHPNVLSTIAWLNTLYHITDESAAGGKLLEGVQLDAPLVYADRLRIRRPGVQWDVHPPHIDGGAIERWEDPHFRSCYQAILEGDWKKHDPYDLAGRLNARLSLYNRAGQASVFRTFQGWLALSETAPTQGTLKVFPNVMLSNAYLILRPFFRMKDELSGDADHYDGDNWELDLNTPEFPGIFASPDGKGFRGPRLSPALHPHMKLDETMIPVPKVAPGDMVFWHCDVVHSVEREHTGSEDSAVMYIPAVPVTPQNLSYIARQKETFLTGAPPPDFPQGPGEGKFVGVGRPEDIEHEEGKKAMGLVH